jgi:hypothetical protein
MLNLVQMQGMEALHNVMCIFSSCGKKILISKIDFELLSKKKWWISNGYATSWDKREKMHRLILNAKVGEIVDHIDRNKLNNTRENLRIVNKEENVHNQKKRTFTKNNYKGTQFIKKLGLWQARCRIYGNDFFLGLYNNEMAAAYAYNKKAIELSDKILLNKFDIPNEELEKMLIFDLRTIIEAEKKSKQKGVYWHKKGGRMKNGKWEAKIRINGKYKSLGRFDDENEAIQAYKSAESFYCT